MGSQVGNLPGEDFPGALLIVHQTRTCNKLFVVPTL